VLRWEDLEAVAAEVEKLREEVNEKCLWHGERTERCVEWRRLMEEEGINDEELFCLSAILICLVDFCL
jgi:hypothetical protein